MSKHPKANDGRGILSIWNDYPPDDEDFYERWYMGLAGHHTSPVATCAVVDEVSTLDGGIRADGNRCFNPARTNGCRQFTQRSELKMCAGLVGIFVDNPELQKHRPAHGNTRDVTQIKHPTLPSTDARSAALNAALTACRSKNPDVACSIH